MTNQRFFFLTVSKHLNKNIKGGSPLCVKWNGVLFLFVSVAYIGFRYSFYVVDFFVSSLDPDPRTRHTIWSVAIGNYFFWLATCSSNQAMVQRCLSLPNVRKANMYVS